MEDGVLAGTITRKVMCTLMKHKAFGPASSDPNTSSRISPLVNWATLEIVYPHYPTIDQIKITEYER